MQIEKLYVVRIFVFLVYMINTELIISFPIRISTFWKQSDHEYVLVAGKQEPQDVIFHSFIEELSHNVDTYIDAIKNMGYENLIFDNHVSITRNNNKVHIRGGNRNQEESFEKCVLVMHWNNFIHLVRSWQQLQSAQCDIITITALGDEFRLEGHYRENYKTELIANKSVVFKKLEDIYTSSPFSHEYKLNAVQAALINHLCKHPIDVHSWMVLANFEFLRSDRDPYKIENYLENALLFEPDDIHLVLFLAGMQYECFGFMKESTFLMLNNLKTDQSELLSMIEYAKSAYYCSRSHDKIKHKEFENHLIKSIEYCDKHARNSCLLGKYYIIMGRYVEGVELLKKAVQNTQRISKQKTLNYNYFNIEDFFNYYYTGFYATEIDMHRLEQLILETEAKVTEV